MTVKHHSRKHTQPHVHPRARALEHTLGHLYLCDTWSSKPLHRIRKQRWCKMCRNKCKNISCLPHLRQEKLLCALHSSLYSPPLVDYNVDVLIGWFCCSVCLLGSSIMAEDVFFSLLKISPCKHAAGEIALFDEFTNTNTHVIIPARPLVAVRVLSPKQHWNAGCVAPPLSGRKPM